MVAVVVAADVAAGAKPVPPKLNPPKRGFWAVTDAAGAVAPEACVVTGAKGDGLLAPPDSGAEGLENRLDAFCAAGCAPNSGVKDVG